MRPLSILLVASATTCFGAPLTFAADPPSTAAAPSARPAVATDAFLSKLAVGNKFEIDSSTLALSRSKSETVKTFASQMVSDHGQAAVKMKQAVTDAKLKAPGDALDARHQAMLDDLKKKDGPAFDQAYVDAQLKGHEETVAMFEAYSTTGDNPRIKQFASDLLPTLRMHLENVRKLQAKTGKS
jgi:putative membrane protein